MENILFHQDNAPVHKSKSTREVFDPLGFPLLCHPPYSPVLAPCFFAIFPFLKKWLRDTHHDSNDKLKEQAVINMCSFRESFFRTFQNWEHRHEKYIKNIRDIALRKQNCVLGTGLELIKICVVKDYVYIFYLTLAMWFIKGALHAAKILYTCITTHCISSTCSGTQNVKLPW